MQLACLPSANPLLFILLNKVSRLHYRQLLQKEIRPPTRWSVTKLQRDFTTGHSARYVGEANLFWKGVLFFQFCAMENNNNINFPLPNELIYVILTFEDLNSLDALCNVSQFWHTMVAAELHHRYPNIYLPGTNVLNYRELASLWRDLRSRKLPNLALLIRNLLPPLLRPYIGGRVWKCNYEKLVGENEVKNYVEENADTEWCDSTENRVEDAECKFAHECADDDDSYEECEVTFNLKLVLDQEIYPDGDDDIYFSGEYFIIDSTADIIADLRPLNTRSLQDWEDQFNIPSEEPSDEEPNEPSFEEPYGEDPSD